VIAWRRGRPDLARAILAPLATGRDASELALHELPVACLDAALGAPTDASRTLALARRAVRETAPALAVQCLALLCRGAPEHRSALRRLLRGLRLPARGLESTRVREVMSVREALATLGAD
jgi:hypothetical protein